MLADMNRKLSTYFVDIMHWMNMPKSPVYTYLWNRACGKMLGEQFDGQTQEDATDYLNNLLQTLQEELGPTQVIEGLFQGVFEERRQCRNCRRPKTKLSHGVDVEIPEALQETSEPILLEERIEAAIQDVTGFDMLSCDNCGQKSWASLEGPTCWMGKRLRSPPKYLKIIVPRERHRQLSTARADGIVEVTLEQSKINNLVILPKDPIEFPTVHGQVVRYELFGVIRHLGDS